MTPEDIEDEALLAELQRRLERDTGLRYSLKEVLFDCGLTLDDLGPDGPSRVWILDRGDWLWDGILDGAPPPLVMLGGDEFGNRPICIRLPGRRCLCLNWRIPLLREPYDPDSEISR